MKNINEILTRQCARIEFVDGKVKYFSISTQHCEADTIEEAIEDIVQSDIRFDGKSGMRYTIEKFEGESHLPKFENIDISEEDINNVMKLFQESVRKSFCIM